MKRLLVMLCGLWAAGTASMLVRVYAPAVQLPVNVDIVGSRPGQGVDVVVDGAGLGRITALGLKTEILIPDVDQYLRTMAGSYHSLAGMEAVIDSIATNYPAIAKKFALGTTFEGRTIWALKISDNVGDEESEPTLLFMGLHHAREWPGVEICLFLADTLTKGYGRDSSITKIVDGRQIWIVPCVNPDGYHYCHDLGNDWRKNRRYFSEFHTYGVDLNRNYNTAADGVDEGEWGSIGGSATTHYPDYESYCGPAPFSEAETKAIRDLAAAHDFIFSVSYHTYQESVMWPFGYDVAATTPDNSVAASVGHAMAAFITTEDGKGKYLPEQSAFLYPTTGDSDDWLYGFFYYHLGKNLLPYTIEACSEFEPNAARLNQIVRANFAAEFYLCTIADSIMNLLTPPVVTSLVAGADTVGSDFTLGWQTNAKSQPQYFKVDELAGTSVTDSAESDSGWVLDDFAVSSKSKHSGNFSFHSFENGSNHTGSVTTAEPVFVNPGDSLTCWCSYDIEKNFDYASVEVSADGRDWTVLDGFTGSSAWVRKAYSLEPWAPSSVFIRFRYSVDELTNGGGFYVDDIHPVARYQKITTLADSVAGSSYSVADRASGTYYYRVRGFNRRGWGDFSPLERLVVTKAAVAEPNRGKISGFRFENPSRLARDRWTVRYQLPRRCPVRLSVYDPSGRMVAMPINRLTPAGAHTEELTLSLPAGIYFLRFQANEFSAKSKIVIVR